MSSFLGRKFNVNQSFILDISGDYYLTQHMEQILITSSEGKNDPQDLFFYITLFLSFCHLKFPEMASPTWL